MRATRECRTCLADISHRHYNAKYCGKACKYKAYEHTLPNLGDCRQCGNPLSGRRVHAKYCSRRCKTAASDRRRVKDGRDGALRAVRRSRLAGLPSEAITRSAVFERFGGICYMCGRKHSFDSSEWQVDHLIPIALPESPGHVWENVGILCTTENLTKRASINDHAIALHAILKGARG